MSVYVCVCGPAALLFPALAWMMNSDCPLAMLRLQPHTEVLTTQDAPLKPSHAHSAFQMGIQQSLPGEVTAINCGQIPTDQETTLYTLCFNKDLVVF